MKDAIELLNGLINKALTSGHENQEAKFIENICKQFVDKITYDSLGNLICHKHGEGKRFMVTAHMDVIGFIVLHIDIKGRIFFSTVGKCSVNTLINTPVRFENGTKGCIRVLQGKVETNKDNKSILTLYIDIGANTCEETMAYIREGDVAVYDATVVLQPWNTIMLPFADNLIGCLVLINVLQQINNYNYDFYAVFTTQNLPGYRLSLKECGGRGAYAASCKIKPDMAIIIDITEETFRNKSHNVSLGNGPVVRLMDSRTISNPRLIRLIEKAAQMTGLDIQYEILQNETNEAHTIQSSEIGVEVCSINIPCRNANTSGGIVGLQDVNATITLLSKIITL